MANIWLNKSDSDDSVNSWTFLDDIPALDEKLSSGTSNSDEALISIGKKEFEKPIRKPEKKYSDSFISFDEYFQERLLDQDYEHAEKYHKPKKNGKNQKTGRKQAQKLGIGVFIAIVLALTAFGTICSLLSQSLPGKLPEKSETSRKVSKTPAEMMKSFNTTLAEINKIENFIGPLEQFTNATHKEDICQRKADFKKPWTPWKPIKAKQRTGWTIMKDFLLDSNVHALVSLVMTNVYLFALLMDYTRRPLQNARAKKLQQQLLRNLDKKSVDNLFKELPFWNAELKLKPKGLRKKSSCQSAPNKVTEPLPSADQKLKKHEILTTMQKNQVKLLKQKFKNTISSIRETEDDAKERAIKIAKATQMFIRKLKYNREKYLMEMRKMKELRAQKKCKEVAVEKYEVTLPAVYDFGEKFRTIKENFERQTQPTKQNKL